MMPRRTEAREKPAPRKKRPKDPKRKRGRPRKGEEHPKESSRWKRQCTMPLEEMLQELPKSYTAGVTRHAKGYKPSWRGDKLPMDGADGGIPVRCLVSSASLHESQTAMPRRTKTAQRLRSLYALS